MKKLFDELANGIIGLIFLGLLLSLIFAFLNYQKNSEYEKSLSKVCGAYQSLIESLRNETLNEEIKRLKTPYIIPDNKTVEGRYKWKVMTINNVITTECDDVYGLSTNFPTYEEIVKGYIRN